MERGLSAGVMAGLALIFGALAVPYARHFHLSLGEAAGIYFCFFSALILALAPALKLPLRKPAAWILPLIWTAPYAVYAAGTADWRWWAAARLLLVAYAMVAVYRLFPVKELNRFAWQDLGAALLLIYILMGHQLQGIWNVPANLDFIGRLFLIAMGSWTWTWVRPIPRFGYTLRLSWPILREALVNFLWFALFAIPVGWALGFIDWKPLHNGPAGFAAAFLEIFLFIALLEEMFFRGFLQTLLAGNFRSMRTAQIVVSCLFGLFHILHAPFPNWRYVFLATVAGWFYGSAFVKTGSLTASALTHAMVDTMWRTFFTKA